MNKYSLSSKLALTGISVFALAMGFAQAGHAWSFSPSYSPSKQISVSAGRDYMKKAFNTKVVTKNKQVTKDSYNRENSHNIEGGANNSVLGDYSVTVGHFANAETKTGSRSRGVNINIGGMAEKSYLDLSAGGDFSIGSKTSESNNYGTVNNNNTTTSSYNSQE